MTVGHIHLRIINPWLGAVLAQTLREDGFAVTDISARDKDGMVSLLSVSVLRKDVAKVETIIHAKDTDAFVTSEDVRPGQRGFW